MREGETIDTGLDHGEITEVIRPAAVVPEEAANTILAELSFNSVTSGGFWHGQAARWDRYDGPWASTIDRGAAQLCGTIHVAYGTPTRYELTIYRVTITRHGQALGWTLQNLTDEALGFGDLTLADCPRADLKEPPKPFRF